MNYKNSKRKIKVGDVVTSATSDAPKVVIKIEDDIIDLRYVADPQGEFNHRTRANNLKFIKRG